MFFLNKICKALFLLFFISFIIYLQRNPNVGRGIVKVDGNYGAAHKIKVIYELKQIIREMS